MSIFMVYFGLGLGLLPTLLRLLQRDQESQIISLVYTFAELIAKTFVWTELYIDRKDTFIHVHGSGRQRYLAEIHGLAESKITFVDFHSNNCSQVFLSLRHTQNAYTSEVVCLQNPNTRRRSFHPKSTV